ncbi:MAG: hypothetical protein CMI53_02815 [Parcubacteria group bacterium]|nr:hypothetical protein [Parcubacteria group bacterium]
MQIGSRKIKPENILQLIKDVRKKKELKHLAEDFVKESVRKHLAMNAKTISFLQKEYTAKSKEYKQVVKKVRAELRKTHSVFGIDLPKRQDYLDLLTKTAKEMIKKSLIPSYIYYPKKLWNLNVKILETHASAKERLDFYERFYSILFKITKKPKVVLDLGSGINPFSIPMMKLKKLTYYAYDINKKEIKLVDYYFQLLEKLDSNFVGKTGILNVLKIDQIKKLPKADICLLLKMTDVLDRGQGHKKSEAVISSIPAKYVVVSFPTLTVSGKSMTRPRRKWIELMCQRLKYSYKIIMEKNEIFYVVKK